MDFFVASLLTVFLVFIGSSPITFAYPDGAPSTACTSMTPNHGSAPQNTPAPYNLFLSSACYTPGTSITVTLRSNDNMTNFRGFMMQARKPGENSNSYGEFYPVGNPNVKALSCFSQTNNTITHNNNAIVTVQNFNWAAPSTLSGYVNLVATVVQKIDTFWVRNVTATLTSCNPPFTATTTTTGTAPSTTTTTTTGTAPSTTNFAPALRSYSFTLLMTTLMIPAVMSIAV